VVRQRVLRRIKRLKALTSAFAANFRAPLRARVTSGIMGFDDFVKGMKKTLGIDDASTSSSASFSAGRGHRLGTAAEAEAQRQARLAQAEARSAAAAQRQGTTSGAVPRNSGHAAAAAKARSAAVAGVSQHRVPQQPTNAPPVPRPAETPRERCTTTLSAQSEASPAPPPRPLVPASLTGAAALLASNEDGGERAARVLAKALGNVLSDPTEPKYRKLKLGNPAVAAAVVHAAGGVELMQEAGFIVTFDAPGGFDTPEEAGGEGHALEGFAVLPVPDGDDEALMAQLRDVRAALDSLAPLLPPPPPPPASAGWPHATRVWLPSAETRIQDLPEEFFTRDATELAADAAARRQKLEESQQLTTRAYKERQQQAAASNHTHAVLRVRMTDGVLLQGTFKAGDRVQQVLSWVADSLAHPHRTFVLHPPTGAPGVVRLDGDGSITVRDAGLCPSAVLTLRWGPDEPPLEGPVLRADLMAVATRLE
jgi:UBX domain-containing protein 6